MGGWALPKGLALPGTGILEDELQGNSFSGDRGATLFPFPSGCASTKELGSRLIPIHLGLQAGGNNFHLSCMAEPHPQMNQPIHFFACPQATKYYWRKSPHQTEQSHYNWVSPTPQLKILLLFSGRLTLLLPTAQSLSPVLTLMMLPPLHSLSTQVTTSEFFLRVTKCLNLPYTFTLLLASPYNWRVHPYLWPPLLRLFCRLMLLYPAISW